MKSNLPKELYLHWLIDNGTRSQTIASTHYFLDKTRH